MGIRVWLDDIRPMPDDFDVWVKDAYQAIELIISGKVSHISFDHDLGVFEGVVDHTNTGYTVAKTIEYLAHNKQLNPISWTVHSANPVGSENIKKAMRSAERFWYKK